MTVAPLAGRQALQQPWIARTGGLATADVEAFAYADWSFGVPTVADRIGSLHPYPARYVLDLPLQAIDLLRPTRGVIDPFCGSGTTLEAAGMRALPAVGVDLNPIACLLSRVRTSPWREGDREAAAQHLARLEQYLSRRRAYPWVSAIPRVDHWFEPWAQDLLGAATEYLRSVPVDDAWHDRIALSISAAVVRLSRQESDTRYAAIDKHLTYEVGATVILRALRNTITFLESRGAHIAQVSVHHQDATEPLAIGGRRIDAAIFSPPYPNAYEYWLYHKYRMYWLGADPISVREAEIGARPHYFKSNPHTEVDFARQMTQVLENLVDVLLPVSPIVIVVGDSLIHGKAIDNRTLLFDAASRLGIRPRAATVRPIRRARSSFNATHGQGRDFEHVLLLETPS